jgi:hypothetical protein
MPNNEEEYKLPEEQPNVPTGAENLPLAQAQTPQITPEIIAAEKNKLELESSFRSGARWFYWIAGLSIINTLIIMFKGSMNFVVGLGITQVIDILGQHFGGIGSFVALALNLIVFSVFIIIGVLCNKRYAWAFWIGIGLYALDGLVFLLGMDLLAIGFHAFVIFCVYSGYKSLKKLEMLEASGQLPVSSTQAL